MIVYLIFAILLEQLHAVYLYDYADPDTRKSNQPAADILEFEPVVPTPDKDNEKIVFMKNINCEEFSKYALNCTVEAAFMYNSTKKSPPMPEKINDWCKAIRHLTNCAIDWNADCKDVTESHFNEESIRGHMHVISHVCEDEWFLSRELHCLSDTRTFYRFQYWDGYDTLPFCIDNTSDSWEECYTVFKQLVDEQKNTTHEWTHFETHFSLCCARTQFRRCTLNSLFDKPTVCSYEQAVTLQKFSVIVSEGDVFQDCDHNMMYSNCPGGDPRPSAKALGKLMNIEAFNTATTIQNTLFIYAILVVLCGL